MTSVKSEDIIELCIKNDRKAQYKVYKEYYGKMFSVCLRYCNDIEEAKDILHEAFLKVFKNISSFRNDGGSFEGWIRRIVTNCCIDNVRKNKNKPLSIYNNFMKKEEEIPDEIYEEDDIIENAEILIALIQKLSPKYRTVFNMYVLEDMTHKQISEKLGICVGTSKSNLAKARIKLKSMYENNKKVR